MPDRTIVFGHCQSLVFLKLFPLDFSNIGQCRFGRVDHMYLVLSEKLQMMNSEPCHVDDWPMLFLKCMVGRMRGKLEVENLGSSRN